jgi:hypothetical protein
LYVAGQSIDPLAWAINTDPAAVSDGLNPDPPLLFELMHENAPLCGRNMLEPHNLGLQVLI